MVFDDTTIKAAEGSVAAKSIENSQITIITGTHVTPEAVQQPIEQILEYLRYRRFDQAKVQLNTLSATSMLDSDVTSILEIVQLLIDLTEEKVITDGYQKLTAYLKTTKIPFCKDITYSALLRLDKAKERGADACCRYAAIASPGTYTNEAFYEYFVDEQQIEEIFNEQRLELTEPELCGLVRGMLLANKEPIKALTIAEHLKEKMPLH